MTLLKIATGAKKMSGKFPKGTRVSPTDAYLKQFPKTKSTMGTVTGLSRDGFPRVKWDGQTDPQAINPEFINIVDEGDAS